MTANYQPGNLGWAFTCAKGTRKNWRTLGYVSLSKPINVPVRVSTVKLDQFDRYLGASQFRSPKYGGKDLSVARTVTATAPHIPMAKSFSIVKIGRIRWRQMSDTLRTTWRWSMVNEVFIGNWQPTVDIDERWIRTTSLVHYRRTGIIHTPYIGQVRVSLTLGTLIFKVSQ